MNLADLFNPHQDHHLANGFFGGALLSTMDEKRRFFGVARATPLPTTPIDLSDITPGYTDQGETGSCASHASTKARWSLIQKWRQATGQPPIDPSEEDLSPLWEYYWTRQEMGTFPQDSGSDMRTMAQAMLDHGAVLNDDLPWNTATAPQDITRDLSKIATPPSDPYYGISGYQQVGGNGLDMVASIIAALQQRNIVCGAVMVYKSFFNGPSGHTPMPSSRETLLGGHAIPFYKFLPDKAAPGGGWFAWRGSWGQSWGDNGDGYISVSYIANQRLTPEAWLLT